MGLCVDEAELGGQIGFAPWDGVHAKTAVTGWMAVHAGPRGSGRHSGEKLHWSGEVLTKLLRNTISAFFDQV